MGLTPKLDQGRRLWIGQNYKGTTAHSLASSRQIRPQSPRTLARLARNGRNHPPGCATISGMINKTTRNPMSAWVRFACSSLAILWTGVIPLLAEEVQPGNSKKPEWAAEGRNEISGFLGATDSTDGESGSSVGVDYERRLSGPFGIGAVVEYTGSGLREGVAGITLNFHPWKELKVVGAPGVSIETAREPTRRCFGSGSSSPVGTSPEAAGAMTIVFS